MGEMRLLQMCFIFHIFHIYNRSQSSRGICPEDKQMSGQTTIIRVKI